MDSQCESENFENADKRQVLVSLGAAAESIGHIMVSIVWFIVEEVKCFLHVACWLLLFAFVGCVVKQVRQLENKPSTAERHRAVRDTIIALMPLGRPLQMVVMFTGSVAMAGAGLRDVVRAYWKIVRGGPPVAVERVGSSIDAGSLRNTERNGSDLDENVPEETSSSFVNQLGSSW